MSLSDKQMTNVCQIYDGANQCRYLDMDQQHYKSCNCLKLTGQKKIIDQKTKEVVSKLLKAGQDPDLQGMPIGDGGSCPGYPFLKHIKQGYDVVKKK